MNEKISAQALRMVEPLRDFVRERCQFGADLEVRSVELVTAFDDWLETRGIHWTAKPRPLAMAMRELGFWPKKRSVMYWSGLRLKPAPVFAPDDPLAG